MKNACFDAKSAFVKWNTSHRQSTSLRAAIAAHEPWELVPLGELSLPGILQLRNRRFLVSGMLAPWALGTCSLRRIVPFKDTSTMELEIPSFRNPRRMQPFLLWTLTTNHWSLVANPYPLTMVRQPVAEPVEAHQPSKSGGVLYISSKENFITGGRIFPLEFIFCKIV